MYISPHFITYFGENRKQVISCALPHLYSLPKFFDIWDRQDDRSYDPDIQMPRGWVWIHRRPQNRFSFAKLPFGKTIVQLLSHSDTVKCIVLIQHIVSRCQNQFFCCLQYLLSTYCFWSSFCRILGPIAALYILNLVSVRYVCFAISCC